MKLDKIAGSWASILEEEFKKPYIKDISKNINEYKKSIIGGFYPPNYFDVYKKSNISDIKVLIIVDTIQFDPIHLSYIERQVCDGLDLNLICKNNYDWLVEQGIMFFPRYLTWNDFDSHKEWEPFTDNLLLKITENNKILVITNQVSVIELLSEFRPFTTIKGKIGMWSKIDAWVKEHYKEEIKWN